MSTQIERPQLLILSGPAGAGKTTLARAWCATRGRAVSIQLDEVREMIVSGHADPQESGALQREQYALSVRASINLAQTFLGGGYDVVIDDAVDPDTFERDWTSNLADLDWQVLVLTPLLSEVLARSRGREKRVKEELSTAQLEACLRWPAELQIDTTALSIDASLAQLQARLDAATR